MKKRSISRPVVGVAAVALAGLVGLALAQGGMAHYTASAAGFSGPEQLTAGWNEITLTDRAEFPVLMQMGKIRGTHSDAEMKALFAAVANDQEGTQDAVAKDAALLAAARPVGGPAAYPGGSGSVWVKLEPGDYVLASTDADDSGEPMVDHGFYQRVSVAAGDTGLEPPQADYQAKLVDFDIEIPTRVAAGEHLWHVVNQGGEIHMLAWIRLAEGKSADDLQAFLQAPTDPQALPGEFLGGTAVLDRATDEYVPIALEPGRYVALCFMTDSETAKEHWALGMFAPFTVGAQTASN